MAYVLLWYVWVSVGASMRVRLYVLHQMCIMVLVFLNTQTVFYLPFGTGCWESLVINRLLSTAIIILVHISIACTWSGITSPNKHGDLETSDMLSDIFGKLLSRADNNNNFSYYIQPSLQAASTM